MQAVWYLQTVNGTTINLDLSITAWYNLVTIEVGAIQRMQQYFENREFIKVENITGEQNKNKRHENIILANERIDKNWNSENYKINNSTFPAASRSYNSNFLSFKCFKIKILN